MTTKTPVLDKITASVREFIKWSPDQWKAVTECRCGPGTCATIMNELLWKERCASLMKDDNKEWVCGGQKTEIEIEGKLLFMDQFYREGVLVFNGSNGPLPVSNIPFASL